MSMCHKVSMANKEALEAIISFARNIGSFWWFHYLTAAPLPPISHLLHSYTHQSPPTKTNQQQHSRSFTSQDDLSSLPPLQGNDPPARRSHVYDTHYAVAPWRKRSMDHHPTIDLVHQQEPSPTYSNPSPQRHTRSLSMTSAPASSWMADEATTMKTRTEDNDLLVSRTQVVFDASGQPILKRKRGRPPSKHNTWQGGWVFLAPTVWTVQSCPQPPPTPPSNTDPSNKSDMHDSMTAFTSSDLDMVLPMPRKKRGRKPKHNLAGHSCFVWRDIPTQQSVKKTTSL
ncbi:hypothetical protein K492DRAFT_193340 [Lichtheimia hyalospora FSU 10163]|nr:hypothetical protein K492DRAFT_193340 [Lichtheimia hyalospora FSU 10163]